MSGNKEALINAMLSNISNEYDKSEGTFFYDVIAPVAIMLEKLEKQSDEILTKSFADTSTGKDLDRIVSEVGINRKRATKANGYVTVSGINGSKIVSGEKVSSDNINFIFLEDKKIENKEIDVLVECEMYGTEGNIPAGAIKYYPKTLQGLQTVTNKQAFVNGYDEENDEALRERYYIKVRTPATSGNIHHYKQWCLETIGVGDCRIFPLWNGNGTVKCVIINANKTAADETLIKKVTEHIEQNRPIGATVTVISAIEKPIDLKVKLIIKNGYELNKIKNNLELELNDFFKDNTFSSNYISIAKIGNIILASDGVEDYTSLVLNNNTSNINLDNEEIAILNKLELEV
ncbi:baseplate J/gp47 family protein [Clostridium botulinum]|uniref:baseplate J/gp47 family protein n=1 Tax=Clostridium botulinum TaxID=1491 RepID=UPI001968723E|nr:baseplate J/gp47 family protein [Clostridium botulinum]MBN1079261.1 baseplate J protein [Clostridium botulinum]